MGSGVETAREAIEYLNGRGARLGLVQVHLFRPFSVDDLLARIPPTVASIAVLDRTKEPGAAGEPLYQDVMTAFGEAVATGRRASMPRIVGGRYGLSSKEFTPAMVKAVFDNLAATAAAEPLHGRHQRRRVPHEPRVRPDVRHPRERTSSAACSTASARTGPLGRTRTRSRSSAKRRPGTRRASSSTTRRSQDRGRRRTCGSGRGRFGPPTSCSVPTSSPVTSSSS